MNTSMSMRAISYEEHRHRQDEVAARIAPNRKRLDIMSTLATGWLPWGIEWFRPGEMVRMGWQKGEQWPGEARTRGQFAMSCGLWMKRPEAEHFIEARLLSRVRDADGTEGLAITEDGKTWLARNWDTAEVRARKARARKREAQL